MRVLLAFDGSAGSWTAADLVRSLPWSEGSEIRVVAVREPTILAANPLFPPTPLVPSVEIEDAILGYMKDEVGAVVARLRDAGLQADGHVLGGRPATVLVEDARRFGADLVVAGSRGRGTIASLVLGSVSAELVDQASCPVLVARRPTAAPVLLATDGSASAEHAEAVLGWPTFAGAAVRVISVADVPRPWHSGVAPTMQHVALDAFAEDLEVAKTRAREIAQATVDVLSKAGRAADTTTRIGDSATEIIAEAGDWNADLIVLGSRGLTGLSRVVLGSVARNVLEGSHTSVLIARESAVVAEAAAGG